MIKYLIKIKFLNKELEEAHTVEKTKNQIIDEIHQNFQPESKITKITLNEDEEIILNMDYVEYIKIRKEKG